MEPLLNWLIEGAVGPALVSVPVTWAAADLTRAARNWFRRLRRSDGLSRIVMAAAKGQAPLSDTEFAAIRQLLEQEGTWLEMGQRTIEGLARKIAACLREPDGERSLAAGRAIATGLMEFAVGDLEPQWFSRILFARLDRLQADQSRDLDRALISVHADLAALFAYHEATDVERSEHVLGQVARVLDRLPPGPADRGEVAVYLATLIKWLSTDAWPQDVRFGGPTLSPASIERKLRVADDGDRREQGEDNDADELGRRCLRLVVLGGPGSGKTWLARRAVRLCAEDAMGALASGSEVDEIELPLFTTCARLSTTPSSYSIRRAVVASALGQLPDLGGARITEAVRILFEERSAPTLMVADSLDEARGADDRIRQADTLPPAWRIIITSRPGWWNHQVTVRDKDSFRRVSHLQPLCYPEDVDKFISQWFSRRPERAVGLSAQIRKRPALQQAATVPLILAFYCIIGGDEPLPALRTDLYAKVIRRMLTGRWRGSSDSDPDLHACLEILRSWSWSAAEEHPVSGIGTWQDEFLTSRVRRPRDDENALDHVAVPIGPWGLDSGMRPRRFVHRSLQEHLVAEHIALEVSANDAARELLKHLWYDVDWEYAGPAALAMHPHRGQVLAEIMRYVTGRDQFGVNLAQFDDCWQIRLFLARVAQESVESAWSTDAAELIGQARLDLFQAQDYKIQDFATPDWPTSNRPIIKSLLAQLGEQTNYHSYDNLAETIAELYQTEQERAQMRRALHAMARNDHSFGGKDAGQVHSLRIKKLMEMADRLDSVDTDMAQFRRVLLAAIGHHGNDENMVMGLAQQDLIAFLHRAGHWATLAMPETTADLVRTVQDRAQARLVLLALLDEKRQPGVARALAQTVAALDPTQEDRAQARRALLGLLGDERDPDWARILAETVVVLDPTQEDLAQVWRALLVHLRRADFRSARELLEMAVALTATTQDQAQMRQGLLALLSSHNDAYVIRALTEAIVTLGPTQEDRVRARQALLSLLSGETHPASAQTLAETIVTLDPTREILARACQALLVLAGQQDHFEAQRLTQTVAELMTTAGDRSQVRRWLLAWTEESEKVAVVQVLAHKLAQLSPTPEERTRARQIVLSLVAGQTSYLDVRELAYAASRLSVTMHEQAELIEALLIIHDNEIDFRVARWLIRIIAELAITPRDQADARRGLFIELNGRPDPTDCVFLGRALAGLNPSEKELAQARRLLLQQLNGRISPALAQSLAAAIGMLAPVREDQARARLALFSLLDKQTDHNNAHPLVEVIVTLNPTADELAGAPFWSFRRDPRLLAAARKNSRLSEWTTLLPALGTLHDEGRSQRTAAS